MSATGRKLPLAMISICWDNPRENNVSPLFSSGGLATWSDQDPVLPQDWQSQGIETVNDKDAAVTCMIPFQA